MDGGKSSPTLLHLQLKTQSIASIGAFSQCFWRILMIYRTSKIFRVLRVHSSFIYQLWSESAGNSHETDEKIFKSQKRFFYRTVKCFWGCQPSPRFTKWVWREEQLTLHFSEPNMKHWEVSNDLFERSCKEQEECQSKTAQHQRTLSLPLRPLLSSRVVIWRARPSPRSASSSTWRSSGTRALFGVVGSSCPLGSKTWQHERRN